MYSLQTQKVGVLKWGALVRRFIFGELKVPFAGDVAVFYPCFQDPNVGRWKYTAAAAKVAMDLMKLRVLGEAFLSSFLKFFEDNVPQGQKAARDMAGYAITAVEDPRVVVAFTFECEYVTAIYNKETALAKVLWNPRAR